MKIGEYVCGGTGVFYGDVLEKPGVIISLFKKEDLFYISFMYDHKNLRKTDFRKLVADFSLAKKIIDFYGGYLNH